MLGTYLCCQGETEDHKNDEYDDVQAARQSEEGFSCARPESGSRVGLAVIGALVGGGSRFERGLGEALWRGIIGYGDRTGRLVAHIRPSVGVGGWMRYWRRYECPGPQRRRLS